MGVVQRRVGKDLLDFQCPLALVHYQKNMFGINKGDQMQAHGARFSNHVHFKKWHKRVHLATLDCGLLNLLVVWNKTTKERALFQKTEKA